MTWLLLSGGVVLCSDGNDVVECVGVSLLTELATDDCRDNEGVAVSLAPPISSAAMFAVEISRSEILTNSSSGTASPA